MLSVFCQYLLLEVCDCGLDDTIGFIFLSSISSQIFYLFLVAKFFLQPHFYFFFRSLAMDRPPIIAIPLNTPPRRLQQVSSLATHRSVTSWMVKDVAIHGEASLNSRVIQAFPKHFRGQRPANLVKAMRTNNNVNNSMKMLQFKRLYYLVAEVDWAKRSAILPKPD